MVGMADSGQVANCPDLPSETAITGRRSPLYLLFPDALSVSVDTLPLTEHANRYIAPSGSTRIHNPPSPSLHYKPVPEIESRSFSQARQHTHGSAPGRVS